MPILLSKNISDHSAYAIWKISETELQLSELISETPPDIADNKKSEWIVTRILVQYLCSIFNIDYQGMDNHPSGKPFLMGKTAEISITHSFPMAGAMINLNHPCGIDIELPREKLINIQSKFLHLNERKYEDDVESLCKIWMAKEVLYKVFGRSNLSFKNEMEINIIDEWNASGKILKEGHLAAHDIIFESVWNFRIAYSR
jgi:4'-phosphopantetheinyl transferase